ncbi:polysaccharide pyruvyl transferase family protein [Kribbella italica]|uniref:Polysaccharide pyruvyl transferase WcaK-like protein n=1 Tax=Kribbella italica TaxID=1540520 RepID=A0A7W9J1V2_9ACTN|nr:polysaccharide pyruvyl transferase family protein [Kribbella italica]MBB5834112.1 polysaccharide pyruvyl transferase WcaK-like protein [Kribbella italica]
MTTAPRIAVLGLLGSGNLGNQGSLEAMLQFLRKAHPDSPITCVCSGPEEVERQYGIPSFSITWYRPQRATRSRLTTIGLKLFGKVADLVRTPRWVRRYDIVIVPGMGVLETTLQLQPWGWPYALFLVFLSARLSGAKTALVGIGANVARERSIRWLFRSTANLATYRSYRDEYSRDALRSMGVDTSRDEVCPDLAFALPPPPPPPRTPGRTVGLGVMAYHGSNADRARSEQIYSDYVVKITEFARWLVDEGYRVRLFTGDPSDQAVVDSVAEDLRRTRPELADSRLIVEPTASFGELTQQLAAVDLVVASRYHNLLAAMTGSKPAISISYAAKNDILMEQMGLAEFRQPIQSLDVARLIGQFRALEVRAPQLTAGIESACAESSDALQHQYAALSAALFGPDRVVADHVKPGTPGNDKPQEA